MMTAQFFSISMHRITSNNQNIIDIPGIIQKELTEKEILEIDMRLLGDIVVGQAKALSSRVDHELLKPISVWINDSDWMKKFQGNDNGEPNWAIYKQRSRQWTKQQKYLAKERLKQYWQEIHRKRHYQKKLSQLLNATGKNKNIKTEQFFKQPIDTAFISNIVAPFSPMEKHRTKIAFEFHQAYKLSISDLLPWKAIIISEITETGSTTLNEMRIYLTGNKKWDSISKFQHLLQMDMDGEVSLEQFEHTGQIQIIPKSVNRKSVIEIKDNSGQLYNFDWSSLNDAQKNKIITDAIERKILCRNVDYA